MGAESLVSFVFLGVLNLRLKQDVNGDTRELSLVFFVHSIFFSLYSCGILLLDESETPTIGAWSSLILSADVFLTGCAYFLPKFWNSGKLYDEDLPDVFVHTTMAIIDVVGFPAWSAERQPVEVFQFLDLLYAQYEILACRHGAFNVESIDGTYGKSSSICSSSPRIVLLPSQIISTSTSSRTSRGYWSAKIHP